MSDRRVFVSYSHADKAWADALFSGCMLTTRGYAFQTIDWRSLVPGDDFDEVLANAIKAADAFVLLVSTHFLASDYVRSKEWHWMRERQGVRICWIPIGDLSRTKSEIHAVLQRLHSPIGTKTPLTSRPPRGKRLEEVTQIVHDGIEETLDPIGAKLRQKLRSRRIDDVTWVADGEVASVFSAKSQTFDRRLAIKVARHASAKGVFLDSVRKAADLAGIPHVMAVYDIDEATEPVHCVTEYVEGRTVARLVEDNTAARQRIAPRTVHSVMLKLSLSLKSAHERRVAHLNIKPSNIIVDDAVQQPYLSPTRRDRRAMGSENVVDGSDRVLREAIAYTLPELAEGSWSEEQADVYALGLVGYQMLSGTLPNAVANLDEIVQARHVRPRFQSLVDIAEVRPDCPIELACTVMRMTERQPVRRLRSFDDVLTSLMKLPPEHIATVELSWRRCLSRNEVDGQDFFECFYAQFFGLSEDIRPVFRLDKDAAWPTERQRNLLRDAVLQLIRYHDLQVSFRDVPEQLNPLVGVARQHAKLPVQSGHFPLFAKALVLTVEKFDPAVDKGLGRDDPILKKWERVVSSGVDYLQREVARLRGSAGTEPGARPRGQGVRDAQ